jgi:hypothetical protein
VRDKTRNRTTENLSPRHSAELEPLPPSHASRRYVPYAVVGASLAVWHDRQADKYVVLCPECQRLILYDAPDTLYVEIVWSERQCCRGCRARIMFERNPTLIETVLEHWYRNDSFPQSPSWIEAIPWHQCTMWAERIHAGLEAATAPMMRFPSVPS